MQCVGVGSGGSTGGGYRSSPPKDKPRAWHQPAMFAWWTTDEEEEEEAVPRKEKAAANREEEKPRVANKEERKAEVERCGSVREKENIPPPMPPPGPKFCRMVTQEGGHWFRWSRRT